ncbi:MAG: hypothetical protein J6B10_09390 [Lachnospiraceae bacterium]|nr:hypothetical protein [Lachnospiraceae bacterium]
MRKDVRKVLVSLAVCAVILEAVPALERENGTVYAEEGISGDLEPDAEPIVLSSGAARDLIEDIEPYAVMNYGMLKEYIDKATDNTPMMFDLVQDITVTKEDSAISLSEGKNVTINLCGYAIDSSQSGELFAVNGGSLTITDTGGDASGTIKNIAGSSALICVNDGSLVIEGGGFQTGNAGVLQVSGGTAEIGKCTMTCESGFTVHNTKGGSVTIRGASIGSAYGNAVRVSQDGNVTIEDGTMQGEGEPAVFAEGNGSLTIRGGRFIASSEEFNFACYADGTNTLNISGGTFTLKAPAGKSLYMASTVNAAISGGGYPNAIARSVGEADMPDAQEEYYKAFYGETGRKGGILASGYVLTKNTFTTEPSAIIDTESDVEVVPGSMITLNTNRSSVEAYGTDEAECVARDAADNGGIVFVGTGGTLYSDEAAVPKLDTSRLSEGDEYEWAGWQTASGAVYTSVSEYAKTASVGDTELTGKWNRTGEAGGETDTVKEGGTFTLNEGTRYSLGSGQWKIAGDNTVYQGGVGFYVQKSGIYEFTRQ